MNLCSILFYIGFADFIISIYNPEFFNSGQKGGHIQAFVLGWLPPILIPGVTGKVEGVGCKLLRTAFGLDSERVAIEDA